MHSLSIESLLKLYLLYSVNLADYGTRTPILFLQVMNFVDQMLLKLAKHPLCSTKVLINVKKTFFHSNTQQVYDRGINVIALSYPVKSLSAPVSQEPHGYRASSSLKNSKMLSKL